MAVVHEKLYSSESYEYIDMAEYVEIIVSGALSSETSFLDLDVRFDLDNIMLNVNKAIPFGLVLNELISIMLQHVGETNPSGGVLVSLKALEDQDFSLEIADLREDLHVDKDLPLHGAFGLNLVEMLTGQIDGEVF